MDKGVRAFMRKLAESQDRRRFYRQERKVKKILRAVVGR